MSTIIVAIILAGFITGICLLLASIVKNEKRKRMNKTLHRFSELGSKYNMTFYSQEILKNCVIGLDGVRRKLLVLNGIDEKEYNATVVDLSEVKNCFVKKQYSPINGGELQNKKLDTYLELLVLHFELVHEKQSIEVPFYQYLQNHINELAELEQKAKQWETLLSKMLKMPHNKIV